MIKAAQRLGFTLNEVAELLDAGRHRRHTGRGLHQRAQAKLAEIDAKLTDLSVIRAALAEVVVAGCDDLTNYSSPDCPLPFAELASPSSTLAAPAQSSTPVKFALQTSRSGWMVEVTCMYPNRQATMDGPVIRLPKP